MGLGATRSGSSQRNIIVAVYAPANWATMNHGTSRGRMPANVSLRQRAMVTAGLAKEVDEVNQYAAVMYEPTANATISGRDREQPQMTQSKPKVARNSLNH